MDVKREKEMREELRKEINAWMVDLTNELGYPPDIKYLAEITGIKASTLYPISRGDRLPSWDNTVILGRHRPRIWEILDLPSMLPASIRGNKKAEKVVELLTNPNLTDEDFDAVLKLLQARAEKVGQRRGAASPV